MAPRPPSRPLQPSRAGIARPAGAAVRRPPGAGPSGRLRPLRDLTDPGEDLLEKPVKYDGGLGEEERARVVELTANIREQEKRQRNHMKRAGDVYYYRTFVFESEQQADAFMAAVGYPTDEMFVDGRQLAAQLKIPLPSGEGWKPKTPKRNRKFTEAARDLK